MTGVRREPADCKYVLQVLAALYISGIVPSKIFMLFNKCCHGSHPLWSLETLESTFQSFLDFWKALVVALQGVTGRAHRIFYIAQSSAGDAPAGGRVV